MSTTRTPHAPVLRLVIRVSLRALPPRLSASVSAHHCPAAATARGDLSRCRLLRVRPDWGRLRSGGLGAGSPPSGRCRAPTGGCWGGCHRRSTRQLCGLWWWLHLHLHSRLGRLGNRARPSGRPGAPNKRVSRGATHRCRGEDAPRLRLLRIKRPPTRLQVRRHINGARPQRRRRRRRSCCGSGLGGRGCALGLGIGHALRGVGSARVSQLLPGGDVVVYSAQRALRHVFVPQRRGGSRDGLVCGAERVVSVSRVGAMTGGSVDAPRSARRAPAALWAAALAASAVAQRWWRAAASEPTACSASLRAAWAVCWACR
jgi:hypothetical protein